MWIEKWKNEEKKNVYEISWGFEGFTNTPSSQAHTWTSDTIA